MSKFAKCVCLINSLLCGHQSYLLSAVCCIFHEVNFSDFAHLWFLFSWGFYLFIYLFLDCSMLKRAPRFCWAAFLDILAQLPLSSKVVNNFETAIFFIDLDKNLCSCLCQTYFEIWSHFSNWGQEEFFSSSFEEVY